MYLSCVEATVVEGEGRMDVSARLQQGYEKERVRVGERESAWKIVLTL